MKGDDLKSHLISGILGALASYSIVLAFIYFLFLAAYFMGMSPLPFIPFCTFLFLVPLTVGSVGGVLAYVLAKIRIRRSTFWLVFPGVLLGYVIESIFESLNFVEDWIYKHDPVSNYLLVFILWVISGTLIEVIIMGIARVLKIIRHSHTQT